MKFFETSHNSGVFLSLKNVKKTRCSAEIEVEALHIEEVTMSHMTYERMLVEAGLLATTNPNTQLGQNFASVGQDFGGFLPTFGPSQQHETTKLKCSTRTVSYATLHVSTTTKF